MNNTGGYKVFMEDGYIVKRCGRDEYPDFLDAANNAFNYGAENFWFQKRMHNCTPYPDLATDLQINRHVIAIDRASGAVMGGVGAYPLDVAASEDMPGGRKFTIPSVGIGQVSCLKEYRGRGVMTSALTKILRESAENGAAIAYLGGDRYRYGRFGFDYGGGALYLDFRYERLKKAAAGYSGNAAAGAPDGTPSIGDLEVDIRKAGETDSDYLDNLYKLLPSCVQRSREYWKMQLNYSMFAWNIGRAERPGGATCSVGAEDVSGGGGDKAGTEGDSGGCGAAGAGFYTDGNGAASGVARAFGNNYPPGCAFMAYKIDDAGRIAEIYGDPDVALTMLLRHMESHALDKATVSLPYTPVSGGVFYKKLISASSRFTAATCGMNLIAILNPERLYGILEPVIKGTGMCPGSDEEKLALLRALLGSPGHPGTIYPIVSAGGKTAVNQGIYVRPLVFWVSDSDNV